MIYQVKRSILSYLIKPFLIIIIIIGIFGLVGLRSSITTLEYKIGILEKEKAYLLRQKKALIAKRASLLSMKEVSFRGMKLAGLSYPDRKKVIYVKRQIYGVYDASMKGDAVLNEQKGGNP